MAIGKSDSVSGANKSTSRSVSRDSVGVDKNKNTATGSKPDSNVDTKVEDKVTVDRSKGLTPDVQSKLDSYIDSIKDSMGDGLDVYNGSEDKEVESGPGMALQLKRPPPRKMPRRQKLSGLKRRRSPCWVAEMLDPRLSSCKSY